MKTKYIFFVLILALNFTHKLPCNSKKILNIQESKETLNISADTFSSISTKFQNLKLSTQQACINKYKNEISRLENSKYKVVLDYFIDALETGVLDLENKKLDDTDMKNLFSLIVFLNWVYTYVVSSYGLIIVKIKGNNISKDMINRLLVTLHATYINDTYNNTYLDFQVTNNSETVSIN